MTHIDTHAAGRAHSSAGAAGSWGLKGSFQERADQLVRATVLGGLGQGSGKSSSIQGIAAAIRKVMSKSDVAGTDVPDDVLKKIEQSLRKAAQALADRGVDAKTIDATIDKFRAQLADALDSLGSGSGSDDASSGSSAGPDSSAGSGAGTVPAPSASPPTQTSAKDSVDRFVAREVRKQRGSIEILTAEGDQVSIRFRTKDITAVGVKQTTGADGTVTTDTRAHVISRGKVSIEVNGDLNEAELAAIGNLLTKVDEIATKFFSGDVQAAFAAASDLGVDSDQIAAYQLDLTYTRKVAAAAWGRVGLPAPAPAPQPAPGGASGSGASTGATSGSAESGSAANSGSTAGNASGVGATDGSAASGSSPASDGATGAGSDTSAATGATAPANENSQTPPTTGTPPASAQKTIADFIGDVLSKLGSVEGGGRFKFSMHWKVHVLVAALDTLKPAGTNKPADAAKPAEDTAAKSTKLLGDALAKTVG